MEKGQFQEEKLEELKCFNKNCWLVRNLNYDPYKRCQYCELKFPQCMFLRYQIISLFLIIFILTLSYLIERRISELLIISVFTLIIIYGYFFNKSTDEIIKANFAERKANQTLDEMNKTLKIRVDAQTKEIRKAYEELRVLDKAKSEFISIASHQLRTPLTAIKGYISMIIDGTYGELSEKSQRPIENIYQSNERLIRLVNDLLNLSRLEAGKIEFKPELHFLEKIIQTIIDELKINAQKKGLSLNLKLSKNIPQIMVDENKLSQVLLNIFDNAIKYTQKGEITIELEKIDNEQQIKISDTGAGMTEDEIKSIFQTFSRTTAGNQLNTEGAGIGLYIGKKFVAMHQGKIWAESLGKGKGSTFYIRLPEKQ